VALGRKRFGTVIVAVGFILLLVILSAGPAWAQAAAELTVDKTGSPNTVVEGEEITYTIEVSNTGDAAARAVVVEDRVPNGARFVSAEAGDGTCEQAAGEVTCNLGTLDPGENGTVTLTVRATGSTSPIVNTATADSPDADPASDTARTRVVPDLEINKFDDPDPVSGTEQLLLYTLRVINVGRSFADEVIIVDDLPLSEVDFVAVDSGDFNCEFKAGLVRCWGSLASGEIGKVEIVVEPEVAGTIQNTAAVGVDGFVIDTDTEETLVQDSAVADEGAEDTTGEETDGGTDEGTTDGTDDGTDEATDTGDGAGDTQYAEDVIQESIPDEDLPETGGVTPLVIVLFLVAGAGLGASILWRRS
jgi:uncharacterized repeat protein (TIGR01451 family)